MKKTILILLMLFLVQPISGCGKTAAEAVTAAPEAASKAESMGLSAEQIVNMLPKEIRSKADQFSGTFVGIEKQPYKDEAGADHRGHRGTVPDVVDKVCRHEGDQRLDHGLAQNEEQGQERRLFVLPT